MYEKISKRVQLLKSACLATKCSYRLLSLTLSIFICEHWKQVDSIQLKTTPN